MNRGTKLKATVDRVLEALLAALMALMVVAVLWQVFTRFVLQHPSSTMEELVRFVLIWVSLLGAAYGFGKRLHLSMDLLARRLSDKNRAGLDLLIHALVIVFALAVLIIGGSRLVELTLAMGQTSAALQIKRGYVYLALPFSGVVIIFYAAMASVDSFRRWTGPRS
jgi:TRAP-type C4-dicarboxylate transport system permease small subunit